jgi:hypothetical protein
MVLVDKVGLSLRLSEDVLMSVGAVGLGQRNRRTAILIPEEREIEARVREMVSSRFASTVNKHNLSLSLSLSLHPGNRGACTHSAEEEEEEEELFSVQVVSKPTQYSAKLPANLAQPTASLPSVYQVSHLPVRALQASMHCCWLEHLMYGSLSLFGM